MELIKKRPFLSKIISNMGWLSFDRLIQFLVSFFVVIWVIRYLGPEDYGVLSFVWAFTAIFGLFVGLGLNRILTRELVSNSKYKDKLMGTVFFLQLGFGVIISIVTTYVAVLLGYDFWLIIFIFLQSLIYLFTCFGVIDAWFQSIIRSKFVVISRQTTVILIAVLKLLFIFLNLSVLYFVLISLIETTIFSLLLVYYFKRLKNSISKFSFSKKVAGRFLAESWPLILSSLAATIYLRIDQVMIGGLLTMQEVGFYSVVVKLAEFGNFFPAIIIGSIFPAIVLVSKNKEKFNYRVRSLYSILIYLSIVFAVVLTLGSDLIINLLYGAEYLAAIPILRIYAWSLVPFFIIIALNEYFVIAKLTKFALLTSVVGAIVNIVLNFILIPTNGIFGAAVATLVSYSVIVFILLLFSKTRSHFVLILSSLDPRIICNILKNVFNQLRASR